MRDIIYITHLNSAVQKTDCHSNTTYSSSRQKQTLYMQNTPAERGTTQRRCHRDDKLHRINLELRAPLVVVKPASIVG